MKRNMILIKNAKLLDKSRGFIYEKKDVLVENGRIKLIQDNISHESDMKLLDGEGYILSPGLIDIHTHIYPEKTKTGLNPDEVGIHRGVTTVFDAGSQGASNFEDFYENVIKTNKTNVYAFINLAKIGLTEGRYEIADLDNIDIELLKDVYHKYPDYIKGLKVRASATTVGELGMVPIKMGKKVAKELNIPMLVHIGNMPPKIDDVLNILEDGDIVTHAYHDKPNGMFENGKIRKSFTDARERGVLFDIGHGSASFNFKIFENAMEEGFYPDVISTDIYSENINGPVYSLEETINKILGLGVNLEDVIYKVTSFPAKVLKLEELGSLEVGYRADLSLFKIQEGNKEYKDSGGNTINVSKVNIDIRYVIKDDEIIKQDF